MMVVFKSTKMLQFGAVVGSHTPCPPPPGMPLMGQKGSFVGKIVCILWSFSTPENPFLKYNSKIKHKIRKKRECARNLTY